MPEETTPPRLATTLYDVIAAIQDVLRPDDSALVVATVVDLLRCRRLTWLGKTIEPLGQSRQEAMQAMQRVPPRTTAERRERRIQQNYEYRK
jgi:hypothetical protein